MAVALPKDMSRDLMTYREPCDMTVEVTKASNNLSNLLLQVNHVKEKTSLDIHVSQDSIDEILDSLRKLDSERLFLCEAVESETIRASIYRHKLKVYPRDIEGEIRDAIRSARHSNDMAVQEFKDRLANIEQSTRDLQKEFEYLTVSNVTLDPEKVDLKSQHEVLVNSLNQTLSDKANMQIRLNETREKLADTIQRKLDFEEAFKELKEDMEAVRDESNVERDRLNAMIGDTRAKIEAQQKINFEQSQEVEYYQQKSDEKDEQITEVLEKITFHEIRVKELENIVKDLSARLEKKCKENAALIESAAMCKDDHLSLIIRYREDKKKLENDITLLNSELQIGQIDYDNFQTQKIRAMHLLDAALLAGRKDKDEAEEMQKSLRNVKDDLLHQTSECTRLKRENIDLEIIIDQTKQDHLATIEVLQKQTNEFQTSLANERKGRVMLQHKRDDIQKKSSVFFMNYSQFATDITKEINEGKLAHQRQTRKGKDLQDGFKKAETQIKTRQEDLLKAKEDYVKLNKSLKGRANKLQKSINALEENLKKRTEKYEQGVPVFKELQEMHKRKVEDYEKMKKHIVDIKSKKVDLENSVLKKQDQLHKLEGPKSIVYKELQEVRKEYKTQVHEETVEVRGIENEIFIASQRLNAIRKENKKFEEANEFFEKDIEFMKCQMETLDDGKRSFNITINEYRDWLENQWKAHMELDKKYQIGDVLLMDDIKKVEEFTSTREKKLESIHERMEKQLSLLSTFLEKAAHMRPPSSITSDNSEQP